MFQNYRFETRDGGWIEQVAPSYSKARAMCNAATNAGLVSRIPCLVRPSVYMVDYYLVRYQAGLIAKGCITANLYRHEWCVSIWQ